MPLLEIQTTLERAQKRWIFGALGIALLLHVMLAGALGWYKIPALEVPSAHTTPSGPFTVKRVEINPESLKPDQPNPIAKLPAAEPPKNPAEFNLDTRLVEKALQAPLPALAAPAVPEPNKVIAATDLNQGLPLVESDSAKIEAEITKTQPVATVGGPQTSSRFAQDLINTATGSAQAGATGSAPAGGSSATGATGTLPGFAQLAPGFHTSGPNLSNLPEPILLRLPSDVLFDFDSASLKPEADPLLTKAIGLITQYSQADVQIDGYTDSFGKPDYNVTLSQQRAEAVQTWLRNHIAQGSYQYHSQGHGSTRYVVSDQGTIEQQQPNRRVEIVIQALKL